MALTKLLEQVAGDASQTQLAARCGVAQTTISAWVRGASLPPSTRIPALAVALGIPEAELRALVDKDRRARSRRLGRIGRRVPDSVRAHAHSSTARGGK